MKKIILILLFLTFCFLSSRIDAKMVEIDTKNICGEPDIHELQFYESGASDPYRDILHRLILNPIEKSSKSALLNTEILKDLNLEKCQLQVTKVRLDGKSEYTYTTPLSSYGSINISDGTINLNYESLGNTYVSPISSVLTKSGISDMNTHNGPVDLGSLEALQNLKNQNLKAVCTLKKVIVKCPAKNTQNTTPIIQTPQAIITSPYPNWLQSNLNNLINYANQNTNNHTQYYQNGCADYVSQMLINANMGNLTDKISGANPLYDHLIDSGWTSQTNPPLNQVVPGSIVFWFDSKNPPIYHTGVYVGHGQASHVSSSSGYKINTDNIYNIGNNFYIASPQVKTK